jgi:hypothetical protein
MWIETNEVAKITQQLWLSTLFDFQNNERNIITLFSALSPIIPD